MSRRASIKATDLRKLIQRAGLPAWRKQLMTHGYAFEDGAALHDGNLVAKQLTLGAEPLVVTGNLTIRGLLRDRHRADQSLLIVLGDLDAETVITGGGLFVAGNARVGVLYGASSHDEVCSIAGSLTARTIIDGDHTVIVHGKLDLERMIGNVDDGLGLDAKRGKPRHVLSPREGLVAAACDDEGIDRERLPRRLAAGQPVVADVTAAAPSTKPVRIKRLDLSAKELKAIPARALAATGLTSLDLSNNELRAISPAIGKLGALTELDLGGNEQVRALPDALCTLPALRVLNLRYLPKLSRLPKRFAELAALEELHLDGATLRRMPDVVFALPRLKRLHWWDAKTPAICAAAIAAVRNMPGLEELHLQSFSAALPRDLSPLTRLRTVTIDHGWSVDPPDRVTSAETKRLAKAVPSGRVTIT